MTEAHNLFEYQGSDTKILAHRDDPETSREAAEKMVKSGKLNKQEQEVYEKIRDYCDVTRERIFTAKELAYWNIALGLNYYVIQRRLSGLHNKGRIVRTGEKRDNCMVWRLT